MTGLAPTTRIAALFKACNEAPVHALPRSRRSEGLTRPDFKSGSRASQAPAAEEPAAVQPVSDVAKESLTISGASLWIKQQQEEVRN